MSGIRSLSCCVARLANFISFWFLKNGGYTTAGMFRQKKHTGDKRLGRGGGGVRGVSESVKKGKFVTKVFLQVMHYLEKNLSQILNEVEVM